MKKNYKLQNTNYKQITNYNVQNYKGNGVFEVDQALNQFMINPKSSHGLHQDSFKLQTMTALIISFCGGSRGAVFSKRAPLAWPAEAKKEENMVLFDREINSKKFMLVKNSIIEEKVEAIVNPANEHLAHGGGVAGLISRAGGPEIQRESNQKAPIKTGQATFTTAGTLPYKAVIHTVGPIYRGGTQGEPQLLESAVTSALKVADELKLKSVSLPSISTGIFGYPLGPAIKVIVKAIFDFLAGDSTLEEIHLVEYSLDKAEEIKGLITKQFPA